MSHQGAGRGRRTPLLACVILLALALVGCVGGDALTTPTATVPPAPPPRDQPVPPPEPTVEPTPQPTGEPYEEVEEGVVEEPPPPDVLDVPDEISPEYVETVMGVLDALYSDILAEMQAAGGVSPEVDSLFRALYTPEEAEAWMDVWRQLSPDDLAELRAEPEAPVTTVKELRDGGEGCIVAAVDRSFQGFYPDGAPDLMAQPDWQIILVPIDREDVRSVLNPTPWQLAVDGFGAGELTCS